MPTKISREQLISIGNRAATELMPYCATIYGARRSNTTPASYLGSGTYIARGDHRYVLTAQHVADLAKNFDNIMVGRGNGELMMPVQGGWVGCPVPESDLAIFGLFEETYKESEVRFLDVDRIGPTYLGANTRYLVQGFPGALQTNLLFLRQYTTTSHPVLTSFSGLLANAKGDDIMYTADYESDIDPRGMSGCGAWNLNLHALGAAMDWRVADITFAGVVQRWMPDDQKLILTRSAVAQDFLPGGIEHFHKTFPRNDR